MSTLEQRERGAQPEPPQPDGTTEDGASEDEAFADRPGGPTATEVDAEHPPSPSDTDFVRVFKRGALLGTPVSFVLMGVLMLVATPDPAVLLSAGWAALMGGWYFGAMVVLATYELRGRRVLGALRLPGRRARPA